MLRCFFDSVNRIKNKRFSTVAHLMEATMDGLDTLKAKYLTAVVGAADESALEEVRLAALGKKGEIPARMATLGKMEPEARKAAGALLNALKDEIDAALRARKAALGDAALNERLRTEWLDVTLPPARAVWARSTRSVR